MRSAQDNKERKKCATYNEWQVRWLPAPARSVSPPACQRSTLLINIQSFHPPLPRPPPAPPLCSRSLCSAPPTLSLCDHNPPLAIPVFRLSSYLARRRYSRRYNRRLRPTSSLSTCTTSRSRFSRALMPIARPRAPGYAWAHAEHKLISLRVHIHWLSQRCTCGRRLTTHAKVSA